MKGGGVKMCLPHRIYIPLFKKYIMLPHLNLKTPSNKGLDVLAIQYPINPNLTHPKVIQKQRKKHPPLEDGFISRPGTLCERAVLKGHL